MLSGYTHQQQRSGKVEVMLTPRNNNDAEVSDGSSMTDSTNVNVDEQQKVGNNFLHFNVHVCPLSLYLFYLILPIGSLLINPLLMRLR